MRLTNDNVKITNFMNKEVFFEVICRIHRVFICFTKKISERIKLIQDRINNYKPMLQKGYISQFKLEKEKEHLSWLIDNNAPKEMIEKSRNYLSHYRQRHKEYNDYVADCC